MAKLTVQFNPEADAVLESIAKRKGVSKSDVLRRAIALYDFVDKETAGDPDKRLSITKGDQTLTHVVPT